MWGADKYVAEGIFNPKTVGTDARVTQGLSPLGQQYGAGAIDAQRQALAGYQGLADGSGTSLAQLQMAQAMSANNRAAMSMAGNARGGNMQGSFQAGLGAGSGANAAAAQQGAMLRAQEQQMAYAGMGQLAGQMAGQQFGYDQLNQQGQLGLRGQDLNYNLGKRGLDQQAQQNSFNNNMAIATSGANAVGSMMSGIGSIGQGFGDEPVDSDPRLKNNLQPTSAADAASQVGGFQYRYNQPGLGPDRPDGQQIGVDASQLAQTDLGPTLVSQGPDGMLGVDGARAGIVGLAASGENSRRIAELERMMQSGGESMRYGTASEGAERERQASNLSNEIAAHRGYLQTQRGQYGGIDPYDFAGSPQMYRSGPPTSDPFAEDPYARPPMPTSVERPGLGVMRRGRPGRGGGDEMADRGISDRNVSRGGLGASPVSNRGNEARLAPIEPYRPGSASAEPIPTGAPRGLGAIDAESQMAIDEMGDYYDRWFSQDEAGNWRARTSADPLLQSATPRSLQRSMDDVARSELELAIGDERRRIAAMPRERMLF